MSDTTSTPSRADVRRTQRETTVVGRAINDMSDRLVHLSNRIGTEVDIALGTAPTSDRKLQAGVAADHRAAVVAWRQANPVTRQVQAGPEVSVVIPERQAAQAASASTSPTLQLVSSNPNRLLLAAPSQASRETARSTALAIQGPAAGPTPAQRQTAERSARVAL